MKPVHAIVLISVLLLAACTIGSSATEQPLATETSVPASPTPIPPTATETPVPTATPTSTVTPTPTEQPPGLVPRINVNCRQGPGTHYPVMDGLDEGLQATILGRSEDELWWYVALPDSAAETECWIFGGIVDVYGDTSKVETVEAPPPPQTGAASDAIVNYYFILGDGGSLGCGDTIVSVHTGYTRTGDVEADLTTALTQLFSNHSEYLGELYNALHSSRFVLQKIEFNESTGFVLVNLGGNLASRNDCEAKRVGEQVVYTLRQFPEIKSRQIWLNNVLLEDLTYCPSCK